MTEDKGSLRWLADLMGRAWAPRNVSSAAGKDTSPIADGLLPTDLARDPVYLLGMVPRDTSDEIADRLSAA